MNINTIGESNSHTVETTFHSLGDGQDLPVSVEAFIVFVATTTNGSVCTMFNCLVKVVDWIPLYLNMLS